jgi:hypothetical protein
LFVDTNLRPWKRGRFLLPGSRLPRAVAETTIVRGNFLHRVSCGTVEIAQLFALQLVGSTGVGIVPAFPTLTFTLPEQSNCSRT